MTIELTMTNVLTILALFVCALWAMTKVIAHLYDKRFSERFRAAEGRLAKLERGRGESDERLSKLEGAVTNAPSHKDLADIYERINALSDEMSKLIGEFASAKRTLDLLHQYLLNGGRATQ